MDVDATLARIRELTAEIDTRELTLAQSSELVELVELVEALDEWLTGGGFLPARWAR